LKEIAKFIILQYIILLSLYKRRRL